MLNTKGILKWSVGLFVTEFLTVVACPNQSTETVEPNNVKAQNNNPYITDDGSRQPQYNYDFDFEAGVISGILPNGSQTENDSSSSAYELKSSPGCPKSFDGRPWVFYGNPVKCHLAGYQGPCPKNMKLYPQRSSSYGYCDCNCDDVIGRDVQSPRSYCQGKGNDEETRTIAFVKDTDSCHILFDQEFCLTGSWLVFKDHPKFGPVCEQRRCPLVMEKAPFTFYDFQTNSCHTIGEKCEKLENGVYQLVQNDWVPECGLDFSTHIVPMANNSETGDQILYSVAQEVRVNECREGLQFSKLLKDCIPSRDQRGSSSIG